jgi:predicted phage tail protein
MVAKTDTTNAALATEQTTRANADGALTTLINTAQATANGAYTSVQTQSQALANLDGKLSASWTAKVQITQNGTVYLAGMGIGIQNTDQGIIQTSIAMQADRFVIINPANSYTIVPFQVIGGVVLINHAYMGDMQSIALNAQGVPYWVMSRNGNFQLNGNGNGMRRELRANYDRFYNTANGVLVIEIGELS